MKSELFDECAKHPAEMDSRCFEFSTPVWQHSLVTGTEGTMRLFIAGILAGLLAADYMSISSAGSTDRMTCVFGEKEISRRLTACFSHLESTDRDLKLRIDSLESRLRKLEKR